MAQQTREFRPSPNQLRIFDFVENGRGHGIITAVAGSGKTTTIVKATERIPNFRKVCMLAFNVSIAKELKERVPAHVEAKTFHSLGFGALVKALPVKPRVEANKMKKLAELMLSPEDQEFYGNLPAKLASFGKNQGVHILHTDTEEFWLDIIDHFSLLDEESALDENQIYKLINLARNLLKASEEAAKKQAWIDYDDQLYLPLLWNLNFFKFDWVFVDEAQDTSPVRRELAKRALKDRYGRLVAVGDPKQSIYGFTGATPSAMEEIRREFRATELPLTVSYRCPQAVVKLAQTLVPYIQAAPSAPMGKVTYNENCEERDMVLTRDLGETDAILCRTNAPLISEAYSLIASGKACRILGKEIGQGLIALIKKMKAKNADDLYEKIDTYHKREYDKLIKMDKEKQADALSDKCQCVTVLIENLPEDDRTIDRLIANIENMFSDDVRQKMLTLSTVHKAKGGEWDTVFILEAWRMPSKRARHDWELEQEHNLMYVAYTRAKQHLVIG